MELLDSLSELAGRNSEVKQEVAAQGLAAEAVQLLGQLRIGRGIGQVPLAVEDMLREFLPNDFVHRLGARELVQGRPQLAAPRSVGLLPARKADDAKILRHLFLLAEMVQGGNELARGEVAARAKDNDRARLNRLAPFTQATRHQVVKLRRLVHGQPSPTRKRISTEDQGAAGTRRPKAESRNANLSVRRVGTLPPSKPSRARHSLSEPPALGFVRRRCASAFGLRVSFGFRPSAFGLGP